MSPTSNDLFDELPLLDLAGTIAEWTPGDDEPVVELVGRREPAVPTPSLIDMDPR